MIKKLKLIILILCINLMLLTFSSYYNISNAATYNQVILDANYTNKNGIEIFPESYQTLLNKLVDQTGHTNWKFKPFYTDIDWNELVSNETNCLHNTIYKDGSYPNSWYHSCNKQGDKKYYCASKEITSYYMDPRNFLTETTIFQFLDLSSNTYVSVSDIKAFVKGTYLEGSANGQSYAQMIYDASQATGESAYSIVVKIFQELGNGKDLPYMISGKDSTYPNVYNFFNYGATDGEGNLARGLEFAKNQGWTTPQKALIEGAKLISGSYTKQGQVNKYLYKFDVVGKEKSELYNHQYMTNVQDPNSQASNLYKAYDKNDLLDKSLTFVIPIYKNMPVYSKLPGNASGNIYYVSSNYDSVFYRDQNKNIIGSLRKDTLVSLIQSNAITINGLQYGKISYNGNIVYMAMSYLSPVNTKKDVYYVPSSGKDYTGSNKDSNAMVSYKAQLQNIGWTNYGKDAQTIGNIGGNRRLETINITVKESLVNENLQYRTHVQDYGWMSWKKEGQNSGTIGESKRIEAIQIKFRSSSEYNILYRVYVLGNGWTGWSKNGETAGTTGQGKMITAIEIKVEEAKPLTNKGVQYTGNSEIDTKAKINYNTYLKDAGWKGWVSDGKEAGSSEQNRKIESLKIKLGSSISNNSIQYRAHIQDIGWTNWTQDGNNLGTEKSNKRMESIQIKLKDSSKYNVMYRVHVQDIGWMNWVKNGETAGTVGQAKRIEAIQIKLEPVTNNISVSYKVHVQDVGWQNWLNGGKTAGTTGKSKRLEAIQIKLNGVDSSIKDAIQYKVHVQDIGWMNWVKNGEIAGTTGKSKRIEAIQIKLNSSLKKNIKYRVHVQDIGWTNWVKNGEIAGTVGKSKRIEAIEIKIE